MKESIVVRNLKCGGCAKTIQSRLSAIEGILNINVEVESSTITFECEDDQILPLVKSKLKAIGYPGIDDENTFLDKTRSFVSCASGKIK